MPDSDIDRRLRAAFERTVGRPRQGVAERVIAGIPYERQRARLRLAWLAVPVAIVLGVAIVFGLLESRHAIGTRPVPGASGPPVASAPRTSSTGAGPVQPRHTLESAAGFFSRPDQPGVLYGQPWAGEAVEVTPPVPIASTPGSQFTGIPSPDGSRFLLTERVVDRDGSPLGDLPKKGGALRWADDSRHLCGIALPSADQEPAPGTLILWQPGGNGYEVASLGRSQGQSHPSVGACSPTTDRAVVYQTRGSSVTEFWLLKLSTGAVMVHETLPAGQTLTATSSHDGRYIAFNSLEDGTATILDTTQGSRVTLRGREVRAFSWDGTRALLVGRGTLGSPPPPVELYDLKAGQVLWTAPEGWRLGSVVPEPGGSQILISMSANNGQTYDLWIVGPDGRTARRVASNVNPQLTR